MKSQDTTSILSSLVGAFGADRFHLRQTALGILKAIALAGCCISR